MYLNVYSPCCICAVRCGSVCFMNLALPCYFMVWRLYHIVLILPHTITPSTPTAVPPPTATLPLLTAAAGGVTGPVNEYVSNGSYMLWRPYGTVPFSGWTVCWTRVPQHHLSCLLLVFVVQCICVSCLSRAQPCLVCQLCFWVSSVVHLLFS